MSYAESCKNASAASMEFMRKNLWNLRRCAKTPVHFLPIVDGNSTYLVRWSDGHKAREKQHEIQNVAADMADGGSFLGCAGRGGGNADHANRAGRYAACPANCNRSRNGTGRERYAGFACARGACPWKAE